MCILMSNNDEISSKKVEKEFRLSVASYISIDIIKYLSNEGGK